MGNTLIPFRRPLKLPDVPEHFFATLLLIRFKNDVTGLEYEFAVFKTDLAGDRLPVDDTGSVIEAQRIP